MVVDECDEMKYSHRGDEVESPLLQSNQQHNNDDNDENSNKSLNPFSSLGRQSSIYSLTLDEFQHTLCEGGKNFGSMNMDEFLNSIWSAEENQAINSNNNNNYNNNDNNSNLSLRKQPSLPRQGSLTIPAPLCRKTVDEVWSEIHKGQQSQQQQRRQQNNSNNNNNNSGVSKNNESSSVQNTESAPRQPAFGEMTLEDFLVKAGVVREPCVMHVQQQPHHRHQQNQNQNQQYGMYSNNNSTIGPSFVGRPVIGIVGGGGGGGGNVVAPPYKALPQGGGAIGEPYGYAGNAKRDGGYLPPPPAAGMCFGGRAVNGGGGYGVARPPMGMVAAPVSPVSSDGIGTSENSGGQFGMEMGVVRGRKRVLDGPVEKVVERRQRRMIKNRESAARSRARKQAYTVELEAELNQLRKQNAQLKQALAMLERRRKQQVANDNLITYLARCSDCGRCGKAFDCFGETNVRVQTKAQKAMKKLRSLRRNLSCSL